MPLEITPTLPPGKSVIPAEHNAQVAQQVKSQDISGQSTATGEFGDAIDALDKLAAQVPEVKPKVAATPEATPATPEATPATTPPGPDPALAKRAEELFKDSPTLPPNASPKSSEAFSSIKQKAAREISEREQQIEDLKKKLEAAQKPGPEALTRDKELEDLRNWRAKMDVDFDPKFKSHDQGIEQSRDFIYAQLAKNPAVTADMIAQIKKYGGPDQINLVKFFETLKDPTLQRIVESKVADIEMAKYQKEQAIKVAKENIGGYLKERQESQTKAQIAAAQAVSTSLDGMLGKLDWFAEKQADAKADAPAKQEVADHNKFIAELREQVSVASKDDSPEMRAILIAGMAQLFNLQRRVPGIEAKLAASEKALQEVTSKWEAVKGASRSRLNESAAPAGGIAQQPRTDNNVNVSAADALDAIARQVMEKRAAASGQ